MRVFAAGARRGLLIRGGDILEAASRVDTVVFDKTGTLTAGKPSVMRVLAPSGCRPEASVLAMAAAVERQTNHPIARAIVLHCEAQHAGACSCSSLSGWPCLLLPTAWPWIESQQPL